MRVRARMYARLRTLEARGKAMFSEDLALLVSNGILQRPAAFGGGARRLHNLLHPLLELCAGQRVEDVAVELLHLVEVGLGKVDRALEPACRRHVLDAMLHHALQEGLGAAEAAHHGDECVRRVVKVCDVKAPRVQLLGHVKRNPPVRTPVVVGNFGNLRSNHHVGVPQVDDRQLKALRGPRAVPAPLLWRATLVAVHAQLQVVVVLVFGELQQDHPAGAARACRRRDAQPPRPARPALVVAAVVGADLPLARVARKAVRDRLHAGPRAPDKLVVGRKEAQQPLLAHHGVALGHHAHGPGRRYRNRWLVAWQPPFVLNPMRKLLAAAGLGLARSHTRAARLPVARSNWSLLRAGAAPSADGRRWRGVSGGPQGADGGGGEGQVPSTPLDSADAALRQGLLTRATLRESLGGQQALLDETKASLQQKVVAEAGLSAQGATHEPQEAAAAVEKSEPETPLITLIKERLALGPMPVSEYMQLALAHPEHGYYKSKGFTGIFGQRGDFTTAPEISQMFGEIVAVWVVWTWQTLGCPKRVQLIELGPGRGTMMADMLRAAARFRPFLDALSVHMVDSSEQLQEIQRKRLSSGSKRHERTVKHDGTGVTVHWHNALSEVAFLSHLRPAPGHGRVLPILRQDHSELTLVW